MTSLGLGSRIEGFCSICLAIRETVGCDVPRSAAIADCDVRALAAWWISRNTTRSRSAFCARTTLAASLTSSADGALLLLPLRKIPGSTILNEVALTVSTADFALTVLLAFFARGVADFALLLAAVNFVELDLAALVATFDLPACTDCRFLAAMSHPSIHFE